MGRASGASWCVRVNRGLTALLLAACAACGGQDGNRGSARWSQPARGAVVAKVNGTEIGVDDVRELANATGLSPREALRRLEEDALLAERASAGGYQQTALLERETKRALVRALLAEAVEREVGPETITQQALQERFDSVRASNKGLGADELPKYEAQVREQLLLEQRQVALAKLLVKLRGRYGVALDEAQVDKLLHDKALWGGDS